MYSFDSRVRYSEIDENKQLTVTGIINYLQDCSTFQSEDLGLGIDYLKANDRAWWLSSWQIAIERRPRLGEQVVISTWPYEFRGMYGYRNFTIRDKNGDYLVKANSIWFFFNTKENRPVKVQAHDIRGYGSGEERLSMEYADRRIAIPPEYQETESVLVARHHIDTNHHVNNAQYVQIAREALQEDIRIQELRVEYKQAAVLGDAMIPRVSRQGGEYTIVLCNQEGKPYAVIWLRTCG